MKTILGGVCAPKGYAAAGVEAGIKKNRKDMALVYSEVPAVCAGVFTTNLVKAWCVRRNKEIAATEQMVQAIVANAGCANACTGEEGKANNIKVAAAMAEALGLETDMVLTGATGVIGAQLPMDKLIEGTRLLKEAVTASAEAADDAAHAIMTTDTVAKQVACELEVQGKTVHIGGMVKGSGMIHPNMATMLCYMTTDIKIEKTLLQKALKAAIVDSFNMISVDGDTSTNDMAVIMANGMAGNEGIVAEDDDFAAFAKALKEVTMYLAKEMVRDGEGATKVIETRIHGAVSHEEAVIMAKSVITSELVKTMFFGEDANFGRVLCAMGYSGASFDPDHVTMKFMSNAGEILLMDDGTPIVFDEEKALAILKEQDIVVDVVLQEGDGEAVAWGSDLTHEYVTINGDYRS